MRDRDAIKNPNLRAHVPAALRPDPTEHASGASAMPINLRGLEPYGRSRLLMTRTRHQKCRMSALIAPLTIPDVSSRVIDRWKAESGPVFRHVLEWSIRTGAGGLLFERGDELKDVERYLWLFSIAEAPSFAGSSRRRRGQFRLLATPSLGVNPLKDHEPLDVAGQTVSRESIILITAGDIIGTHSKSYHVRDWSQSLDA